MWIPCITCLELCLQSGVAVGRCNRGLLQGGFFSCPRLSGCFPARRCVAHSFQLALQLLCSFLCCCSCCGGFGLRCTWLDMVQRLLLDLPDPCIKTLQPDTQITNLLYTAPYNQVIVRPTDLKLLLANHRIIQQQSVHNLLKILLY